MLEECHGVFSLQWYLRETSMKRIGDLSIMSGILSTSLANGRYKEKLQEQCKHNSQNISPFFEKCVTKGLSEQQLYLSF